MIKPKDRKHLDFDVFLKESLKNQKIKAEYDRLQPEFALIKAVLEAIVNAKQNVMVSLTNYDRFRLLWQCHPSSSSG